MTITTQRTTQRKIGRAVASAAAVLSTALAVSCGSLESSHDSKQPADNQVSTRSSEQAPGQQSSAPIPEAASAAGNNAAGNNAAGSNAAGNHNESVRTCRAADLSLSLGRGDGAAGTVYRPLRFTNSSDSTCTMIGYPGVSYVAGDNGVQVGAAAVRTGGNRVLVTLAPGQVASATVGFTQVDNFDPAACQKTAVRGLRVYPPHDTASLFIANPGFGCAGRVPGAQLQVKTVVRGPGGA